MSFEGWLNKTVEELIEEGVLEKPLDGNHGNIHPKGDDFVDAGVPFIMASDLQDGYVNYKNCNHITIQQSKLLKKGFAKNGDILISHKATIGRTALVEDTPYEYIVLTPQVTYYRVKNKNQLNNRFLKYYFDSPEFQSVLNAWAGGGSTRAYIGITEQRKLPIKFPSIEKQYRIASILSSLDNKIELNRQTSQTLEAIAQAIFKEWFVDFNFPGATGEMADGIPLRWSRTIISAIASNIQYGYTQSSSQEVVGPKFLRITDIQGGDVSWANVPYCKISGKDLEKYRIIEHDIFIARTGASTGENIYIVNPPNAVFASYLIRVQFSTPALACYVGKYLRSKEYFDYIASILSGSAQPNANAQQLTAVEILLPDSALLQKYFEIVNQLNQSKAHLSEQNQTLTQLRDSLLPKLMKGEILINQTNLNNEQQKRIAME